MQALAFATNTVGVSLEKLGDISKDTNEKIGEFIATGGGTFVDFVDVMKLSKIEANELARELQLLSGPEVLQRMVSMMEAAGVSGQQMSFALEGMGNDATDLLPLLKDNADELNRLTGEFNDLGVALSQDQIDKIKSVSEEMTKLHATFSGENSSLVADYAEEISTALSALATVYSKLTDATRLSAEIFGTYVEAIKAGYNDLTEGTDTFVDTIEDRADRIKGAFEKLMGGGEDGSGPLEISMKPQIKATKEEEKALKISNKRKLAITSDYIKAASILGNTFLEDNKAIQAGIIIADTATGVMRAFATLPTYEAFAASAVIAATGISQLANLQSASKGGGNISGGPSQAPSEPAPDFEQETNSLEVSAASTTGTQSGTLTLTAEDGDEIGMAIANWLNRAQSEGRIQQ